MLRVRAYSLATWYDNKRIKKNFQSYFQYSLNLNKTILKKIRQLITLTNIRGQTFSLVGCFRYSSRQQGCQTHGYIVASAKLIFLQTQKLCCYTYRSEFPLPHYPRSSAQESRKGPSGVSKDARSCLASKHTRGADSRSFQT